jgi:hypothetical protein
VRPPSRPCHVARREVFDYRTGERISAEWLFIGQGCRISAAQPSGEARSWTAMDIQMMRGASKQDWHPGDKGPFSQAAVKRTAELGPAEGWCCRQDRR